ncbi:hypothetical protein Syun_001686 [Stephania yunnanensis]|uniref:Uncharacterized protein n=1 Tax=Stephania yunnanensis TaxID=152371 RepID=A0AAP0LEL6_9MAGN
MKERENAYARRGCRSDEAVEANKSNFSKWSVTFPCHVDFDFFDKSEFIIRKLFDLLEMGRWVEKDGYNYFSEENDQEIRIEMMVIEGPCRGNLVGERVAIDDHVVGDPTKEDVKDRSGREDTMGTPLETAPIEHEHSLMEHEHEPISAPLEAAPLEHGSGGVDITGNATLLEQPSTCVFMEFRLNKVDNMLFEQSHIAKSVDQLDKKVKKLTDMLTKFVGDASYSLNLLHGDMETMLIRTQDVVENTDQSKKMVADFMERLDALLGKYEEQLRQREKWKKWKCTWKPDHIDLDADL